MKTTKVFDKTVNALATPGIDLIISYGGSSSSKTVSAMQALFIIASKVKNQQIYFFAQTVPKLKGTLIEDCKRYVTGSKWFDLHFKEKSYLLFPNGSKIIFLSADDPDKFLGVRSDYILFDEINTYRNGEKTFKNLYARCRKKIIMTFNPAAKFWVSEYMAKDFSKVIHSTYKDNQYAPSATVQKLLALAATDQNFNEVYVKGNWGSLKGVVFKYKERWDYFSEYPQEYDAKYYGMDFGFANDPSTIIEVLVRKKERELYLTEKLYKTGLFNEDLAKAIKEVGSIEIVCDSAEPKSISELRVKHKIRALTAVKGADSINNGIGILNQWKIFLFHKSENLITEFFNYSYAEDKKTGELLNTPVDKDNHLIDPTRYVALKYRL